MQFYNCTHAYYVGIDLHAREMYVCVIDNAGEKQLHRNMPADPEHLERALTRFRGDLVVAVECIFTWYWIANFCAERDIAFVLGHALYMKAIHGAKSKNDRIDSAKIAAMLRRGMLPQAYAYPREMRAARDLVRRREYFMHQQSELLEVYRAVLHELELAITREAKHHDPTAYYLLRSIPGVGPILALVILYEIGDIARFPEVGHFISYARLVKCAHESAGKRTGGRGNKTGNSHLKWAFSEAAVLFLRGNERGQRMRDQLAAKYGNAKALSLIAQKLGRTAYFVLKRKEPFDRKRFFGDSVHQPRT
jgi:transposase